jgi:hypothetical protein
MRSSYAVLLAAVLASCSGGMPTPDGGSGGGTAAGGGNGGGSGLGGGSGGGSTTGGGSGGGGTVDAGQPGETCLNPLPLTLGMISGPQEIDVPAKRIHWAIDAGAGDFLDIATLANPNGISGHVDTVITVYDATGANVLAVDDDAFPRVSTDSELFYRVRTAQRLCIMVQDYSSWAPGETAGAFPTDLVHVTVTAISDAGVQINLDQEPNDALDAGQPGKLKAFTGTATGAFGFLFGGLDTANDVDTYTFTAPAGTTQLAMSIPPIGEPVGPGVSTYGSTMRRFTVTVTDPSGRVVGALAPPAGMFDKSSQSFGIFITAGTTYDVTISRPASLMAGSNDFYESELDFETDNPAELETSSGMNDTVQTAEALVFTANTSVPKQRDAYVLGHINPATDVDFYGFNANQGDTVAVACAAARNGSGLVGATFAITDNMGAVLQSETETATADVVWGTGTGFSKPPVMIGADGGYAFKVTTTSQDATNTGDFYRCGVHVTSP